MTTLRNMDKTLNDYFGKIYCINLKKRPDRWRLSEKEFKKHSLVVERYDAIDGNNFNSTSKLKSGEIGCILSHLNILKKSQKENINKILITEDDVEFSDNLNKTFFDYQKELPDWDMLYFGANHALCNHYENNPPIKVTEHVYRVIHAYSAHAYAVNKSCYQYLIDSIENMEHPLDVIYSKIQRKLEVYLFRPHLAWQRPSYSDIIKDNVDYSFLRN